MFGITSRIKQLYVDLKDQPVFLYSFNIQVIITIRTHAAITSVDWNKMMEELNIIAEHCKKHDMSAKEYLKIVSKYANDAAEGHHAKMEFDRKNLELKNKL